MFFCNCFRVLLTCAVIVCLQVNTDLEPQVASDDSAAELSGLLQDPHFMVTYTIFKFKSIIRKYQAAVYTL